MKSDTAYLPRGELSYFMGYVSAKNKAKQKKVLQFARLIQFCACASDVEYGVNNRKRRNIPAHKSRIKHQPRLQAMIQQLLETSFSSFFSIPAHIHERVHRKYIAPKWCWQLSFMLLISYFIYRFLLVSLTLFGGHTHARTQHISIRTCSFSQ